MEILIEMLSVLKALNLIKVLELILKIEELDLKLSKLPMIMEICFLFSKPTV
jgi:hypothetical protein